MAPLTNHFAFWRTARPSISFEEAIDVVSPGAFVAPVGTTRIDIGHYVSDVAGMSDNFHPGDKEIVMTTTFGATTARCVSDGWFSFFSKDALEVRIDCNDALTGQRADATSSSLIVGAGSLPAPSAYTIASQPTTASYTPDTVASHTTGTGAMFIERIGVGDWYVHLGTGSPQGSTYMVNSFDEHALCTIAEWKNFGARVRCFDRTGALVDAAFKVLQVGSGRLNLPFAFAWADQRSLTTPYTPNPSFSHGTVTAARTSVGDYEMAFAGLRTLDSLPENVQVTAFSGIYSACTVISKADSATSRVIRVQCRNAGGRLADSRFNILLLR